MFKRKNKLILILISFTIIFSIYFIRINDVKAEDTNTSKKGDLRCPNGSKNCQEIKNNDGIVTQVSITTRKNLENNYYIEIVKHVKRTLELGIYEVWFEVTGKIDEKANNSAGDAYIIVIFDTSKTISDNISEAKNAIISFSNKILENINNQFHLGLIQFASNAIGNRKFGEGDDQKFEASNFHEYNYENEKLGIELGIKSHLQKAYKMASGSGYFGDIESLKKYVVLFGDGRYYNGKGCKGWNTSNKKYNDTDCSELDGEFAKLSSDAKIYGIRYHGSHYNNKINRGVCKNIKRGECDWKFMNEYYTNNNVYDAPSKNDYQTLFENLAAEIKNDANVFDNSVNSNLKDYIGDNFNLLDSNYRYKNFNIGNFNNQKITTSKIQIVIKQGIDKGWHETNTGYEFNYNVSNGETQTIESKENPEVYWENENEKGNSCSEIIQIDSIRNELEDNNGYWSKSCSEGYINQDAQQYIDGYTVKMSINNLENGVKKFNIKNGLGFPAYIDISTNLSCNYTFFYENYVSDYSELEDEYDKVKGTNTKEEAEYLKNIENMDKILADYIDLTENDLSSYIDYFTRQEASLKVQYNNSSNIISNQFVNDGEITSELICQNDDDQIEEITSELICQNDDDQIEMINGIDRIKDMGVKNKTCYLTLSKEMILKDTCLNMKTGEQEECNNSNNQIFGGNKFYTSLNKKNGKINIEILDAGYSHNLDINLNNFNENECMFELDNKLGIQYRQISLSDPFNKKYGKNPGRNYANSQYNFVKIIKNDLWNDSNNFNYRFQLSKTNVKDIKSNTKEDNNSYLGRNCHFISNNKYVCDFIRDQDSRTNYFTKVELK